MQINCLYTRNINNHGMDLCQPRNLMVRIHPKHNTQKGMGITSNWQHVFIYAYSFHNWFPDTKMIY